MIKNSEILITGGTGTLGKALVKLLTTKYKPKGIRIYSRDEYKQWQVKQLFKNTDIPISYLIGDIRDSNRLSRACNNVDIIINTAAMKHIDACEINPLEAKKTNIDGIENIINCAIDNNIKKVMHISTDKAVYPINLYGMTKAVGEKLILHASGYCKNKTKFSCCRYGNVLNSRGSIIELFKKQRDTNEYITITHKEMTRFWISIEQVVQFIINNIELMEGNEIFIPKMKSMKVFDIADIIAPNTEKQIIGIRPGEKLHECLITKEESYRTEKLINKYIIRPEIKYKDGFILTSLNNFDWLKEEELLEFI